MPTPYSGKPYNVQANLPAAVNISSSDGGTPIVVTTATAHNCNPGDYLIVIGAQDPGITGAPSWGLFRAGTCTATTVVLLTLDGFNSVGTLVGGAQGTLQQAGFGKTVDVASDGDRPLSTAWSVADNALLDRAAWLEFMINFGRKRRRPTVVLLNGPVSHTIDTSMGDCFELAGNPAGLTTIILRNGTSPQPEPNERIEISVDGPLVSGRYVFQDEATGTIANCFSNVSAIGIPSITFELNGTPPRWKVRSNSGYDPATAYGITT